MSDDRSGSLRQGQTELASQGVRERILLSSFMGSNIGVKPRDTSEAGWASLREAADAARHPGSAGIELARESVRGERDGKSHAADVYGDAYQHELD